MDVQPAPPITALIRGASALPAELVTAIEREAVRTNVAAGTVLVRQHDLVRDLVVLEAGRLITLVAFSGVGDLAVETTDRPGRIFGWSGLRQPRRATATVRADGTCRVVLLPIDRLCSDRPRWTAALCGLVTAGLADRAQDIADRGSAPDMGGGDA